jgi:hypothetical protein
MQPGVLGSIVVSLLTAAAVAPGLAGCSQPTDQQPFPGQCAPLTVVSSRPAPGETGVATDARVALTFSDYPDPDTVNSAAILVASGIDGRYGAYRVDLLTRSVIFQGTYQLWPRLNYVIDVSPPLASLQGCAAKTHEQSFQTGDGPAVPAGDAQAPPVLADVLPIFAQSCAGGACHLQAAADGGDAGDGGGGRADCLAAPAKGLSLCDADAYGALVGVTSSEESRLLRVVPFDSSRSYLLRKLLPATQGDGPVPTTLGHRDPPGAPLDDAQLRTISDWIDGGALQ